MQLSRKRVQRGICADMMKWVVKQQVCAMQRGVKLHTPMQLSCAYMWLPSHAHYIAQG